MSELYEINSPTVVSEPWDGEMVAINLESGCYYNLNQTGARVWRHIQQGHSIPEAARRMARLHGVDDGVVLADFSDFIELLEKERLVRAASGEPEDLQDSPYGGQDGPYVKPGLEKYSDMQEMLLLDPIHEVTEQGWPHKG